MAVQLSDLAYAYCCVCGRPAVVDTEWTRCSEGHEVRIMEIAGPMDIHAPHLEQPAVPKRYGREFL